MIFSSSLFLYFFLPAFLGLYLVSPRGWRTLVIALGSYVFYGWWRPDFVALMLFSTLVDYTCGARIARAQARGERGRRWLKLSLVANLGLLGYFKYANFGVETFNEMLGALGMAEVGWTRVVLPIGISFYTFQTMSYTIDVYRRQARPVERLRDFMCYVAMFPQLIAGPIVRYWQIAEQLRQRSHSLSRVFQGVLFFQCGLAKKVLIADTLGPLADAAFGAEAIGTGDAWLGLLAYTFQIYFDFSGYSDMAIGLGLFMGFRFPVNFDGPYRSKSITEFWRRWHISLSQWLRDYLYVPLGGNRLGVGRTYVNLCLVMLLGGLWHGAAWTFIAWGAWQGAWLVLERLRGKRSFYDRGPAMLRLGVTFLVVMFGWVFFRSTDLAAAGTYFASLLGGGAEASVIAPSSLQWIVFAVAAAVTFGLPTSQRLACVARTWWVVLLQLLFVLALLQLHYHSHVQFLYYQF